MSVSRNLPLFAVLVGMLVSSAYRSAAQEPTFKGAVRTVAVFATVTNAEGRLVPDLPGDAFAKLLEEEDARVTDILKSIGLVQ